MEFKAAIFDLDGTLLDTLDDLADAANAMLAARGFPVHPVDAYRYFVGDGMEMLVKRCLPEAEAARPITVRDCVAEYREQYRSRWNAKTRPYDGIAELLSAVAANGVKMAVLSNKSQEFTEKCVRHYLGQWTWDVIFGLQDGFPKKPNQAGAIEITRRLGVAPGECVYFGDTAVDMQTAARAGMVGVGVLWGFRDEKELRGAGAKMLLRRPADYLKMPF